VTDLKESDAESQNDTKNNNYGVMIAAIMAPTCLLIFILLLIMMSMSLSSENYPPSLFTVVSGGVSLIINGYYFVRKTYEIINHILEKLDTIECSLKNNNRER